MRKDDDLGYVAGLENPDSEVLIDGQTVFSTPERIIVPTQGRLGLSVLYVTHDQAEALAMSDRIFVVQNGRVLQEGAPLEIYSRPTSEFVANFIGSVGVGTKGILRL